MHVIILEDLPTDAELEMREVRQVLSHCDFLRVDTRHDFLKALDEFAPDIILSDYKMPQFDGLSALRLAQIHAPDTPFIIVTGSMNEDTAVACMKAGAWDYVIKEHIKRLGPAVQSALEQKRQRFEQRMAREKSRRWEQVFEKAQFGLAHTNAINNTFLEVNATYARERGYTPDELKGRPIFDIYPPEEHKVLKQRLQDINKVGHAVFESTHLRKDGSRFPVLLEITAIQDDEGRPVSRVAYALDITLRRQAEKLQAEEAVRRRILVEQSIDGIVVLDDNGKLYEANKRFGEMLGYTPDELNQLYVWDWDAIWTREQLLEKVYNVDESGECFETRHRRKDGRLIDVEISTNGAIINGQKLVFCVCRDISKRKRVDDALRDSEMLFRNLFEHHAAVKLIIDPETGAIMDANQAAAKFYGWSQKRLKRMRINDINTLSPEEIKNEMQKVKDRKRIYFEFRHRRADGSIRDVEVFSSSIAVKGKSILHSIIHDITDRKQAEAALRTSEADLRKTQSILNENQRLAKLGGWEYDPQTGAVTWTDEIYRIFGLSKDYVPGNLDNDTRFFISEDRKRVMATFQNTLETGEPYDLECQLINEQGENKWVRIIGQAELKTGKIIRLFGSIMDITKRKSAEAERERLTAAINQVGESICITSVDGLIQYVNPAFENVTGYSSTEVIGKNPRILKSGKHDLAFYQDLWSTITSGRTWKGRLVNKSKSDALFTEAVTISPVRDLRDKIVNFVAVKRDITEHLRLEDQFHQAQKMESVGRLAGGVAHDYNNILSVIMGYAELALDKLDNADPVHSHIQEILKAAERSGDITRQLLAFARKQTIAPKVLDLNATVENTLKLLRRLIGENIDLAWFPGANLWPIKIDPTQVDQILANLCVNARDAISGVGRLTIETKNVVIDLAFCLKHPDATEGDYVYLAVTDNGCGMKKQILDKIFEPFFTTKEMGKGTGLGLATVYGIVKQNNGFIKVESEPEKGTIFTTFFPRHQQLTVTNGTERAESTIKGRGETVLLVEDDTAILELIETILESLDYHVLTAQTPEKAIDIAKNHHGAIDLLITDVIMPEMNGRELAEQLQVLWPQLKCLYMSGYTADVIAHQGVLETGIHFIQKPFSTTQFSIAVSSVLGERVMKTN